MKPAHIAILCVITGFGAMPEMAYATTYHAGNDCAPLSNHVPSADIEARSGYNQHGETLTPADLNASSALDTEALKHPTIDIDLPISSYIDAPSFNADLARTDIHQGQLKVEEQGALRLNGRLISSGQEPVFRSECKQ